VNEVQQLADGFAAELFALVDGDDLSHPEHMLVQQCGLAAALLAYSRSRLERSPEDREILATVSRLTANLLAAMPVLTSILGDLRGTDFAGFVRADAAYGERVLADKQAEGQG
jgi:hypothetical protein